MIQDRRNGSNLVILMILAPAQRVPNDKNLGESSSRRASDRHVSAYGLFERAGYCLMALVASAEKGISLNTKVTNVQWVGTGISNSKRRYETRIGTGICTGAQSTRFLISDLRHLPLCSLFASLLQRPLDYKQQDPTPD